MSSERLARTAPELAALCGMDRGAQDRARRRRVVGWAMLVGERVVAYVPDHPHIAGGTLLNTYSSLEAADRLLAYADIRSVRDFSALLDQPAAP